MARSSGTPPVPAPTRGVATLVNPSRAAAAAAERMLAVTEVWEANHHG